MATQFRIGVNTEKEILSNPPPQFRHLNLIYTPFAVHVGRQDYPAPFWTDFAGVFLFRWYRAVLKLESGKSCGVRLPFWYTYEMWLQQAPKQRWRLSLVQRSTTEKTLLHKALVIPEVVESALLTAIQNLLAGARSADVRTEDCIALEALLKGRQAYLDDLAAGRLPRPSFLSRCSPGRLNQEEPLWAIASPIPQAAVPQPPPIEGDIPLSIQRRMFPLPFRCPNCGAVLRSWEPIQAQKTCPACQHEIRFG